RYAKPQSEWIIQQNESWRIVSDELWDAAQRSREANQKLRPGFGFGIKRAAYLLTGLIRCEVCGRRFGGKRQESKNSKYHYYRCCDAMSGSSICNNMTKLRGEELERAVIEAIVSHF